MLRIKSQDSSTRFAMYLGLAPYFPSAVIVVSIHTLTTFRKGKKIIADGHTVGPAN